MSEQMKKLKRAVIKEEFVAITGNFIDAAILNQFIYWTERVKDFDSYIQQENERAKKSGFTTQELTGGWIYKSADELADETMLGLSKSNMRIHIKALEDAGYIDERTNPKYKWDRTKQYRVNLVKIVEDLHKQGYELEGYQSFIKELACSDLKHQGTKTEHQSAQNKTAIPETTAETTAETANKVSKKTKSYDEIIAGYTQNESLKNSLVEFVKMRSMNKRQPLTSYGLSKLLNKLDKLGRSDAEKVEIVDQSVMRGWAGFFEVKEDKKQYTSQPEEQHEYFDLDEQAAIQWGER